jgi:hypothetical protein
MRRISIIGMMRLVLCCAVGLTALRNANDLWAGTSLTLALAMAGIALLGALYQRGKDRAWWVGFALFSGVYLALAFGPWFSTEIRPKLVTTQLLESIHSQVQVPPSDPAPPTPIPPGLPEPAIRYLETGAKLYNSQRFDPASKYLAVANQYRGWLSADERAMLDLYIAELAKVKGAPSIPPSDDGVTLARDPAESSKTMAMLAVPPPTAIVVNGWQLLMPGAANHDQFLMVGHGLFALIAGLAGAMCASRFHSRREGGQTVNV